MALKKLVTPLVIVDEGTEDERQVPRSVEVELTPEEEAAVLAEREDAIAAAEVAAVQSLACTRSQFKLAALEAGKLDAIEGFIAALDPEDIGHREIMIRWAEAPTFYRSYPGWDLMAPAVGETAESVTALFQLALTK